MKLRQVDFGLAWGASGVQGFFGEGYWFHKPLRPFGLRFNNMTFVAKTTTLNPQEGNMPLTKQFTPKEWFPKCIIVKPLDQVVLNAVRLSGPGIMPLLYANQWQKRENPHCISFMSIANTADKRLAELEHVVEILSSFLPAFHAPVALQLNYSCPNVGLHPDALIIEVLSGLDIASQLMIPLVPKFNLLAPPEAIADIAAHPACDAICTTNSIPWGALPNAIDWHGLFGSHTSPLAYLGGGGLSGKPLLPLVIEWIKHARKIGIRKPINGGGGILSHDDAMSVLNAGADSFFIGSMATLRPLRVNEVSRMGKYK